MMTFISPEVCHFSSSSQVRTKEEKVDGENIFEATIFQLSLVVQSIDKLLIVVVCLSDHQKFSFQQVGTHLELE